MTHTSRNCRNTHVVAQARKAAHEVTRATMCEQFLVNFFFIFLFDGPLKKTKDKEIAAHQ